jgi:hypothetical protein
MKTSKYLIKEQKPVYADYHKFLFSVVNQKTEEVVFTKLVKGEMNYLEELFAEVTQVFHKKYPESNIGILQVHYKILECMESRLPCEHETISTNHIEQIVSKENKDIEDFVFLFVQYEKAENEYREDEQTFKHAVQLQKEELFADLEKEFDIPLHQVQFIVNRDYLESKKPLSEIEISEIIDVVRRFSETVKANS